MDLGLADKVALVTAASKGIGLAVARRLAREGAIVAANARNAAPIAAAAADLGTISGSIRPYPADLLVEAEVDALIERVVADRGRLDILVLNTPGPRILPFLETQSNDWTQAYEMLVRPCIRLAHAASHLMVRQGSGAIVFLTSTWVKQPAPGGVLSSVMRSALSALSKQMSIELAPYGVRVNQIQPGATGTDRMEAIVAAKAAKNGTSRDLEMGRVVEQIPLGRWASADEIADAVAYMVSPRGSFITGATLQVDGGAVRSTV